MAIVVDNVTQANTSIEGTTLAVTVPSNIALASRVVVCFGMPTAAGTVSCVDDRGNTYAVDADVSSPGNYRSVILSAPVTTALLTNDVITITCPNVSDRAAALYTITGLPDGGELDQFNTAIGNSDAPSAGSITTTVADEALIAAFVHANDGALFGSGTGWFLGTEAVSDTTTVVPEHRVVNSTGTYTGDFTIEFAAEWSASIVSYQAAGENPAPAVAGGYPWNILRRRRRYH